MEMPPHEFSVDDVADAVGRDTPVAVIGGFIIVVCSMCVGSNSTSQMLQHSPTVQDGLLAAGLSTTLHLLQRATKCGT
jgi:predicted tellurium resistance membrane protein TerC